jgi:transcriptional accessory protein Tex/SPT6
MLNLNETILVEIVRVNTKEVAALYLQDYIQSNGFLSNEAGDIIKKLLKEKDDKPKPDVKPNIEQMIKEIEELPDTIYSGSIMDVTGVSCKNMKDKVIEIIRKYSK